jgi:hypothetical protein
MQCERAGARGKKKQTKKGIMGGDWEGGAALFSK